MIDTNIFLSSLRQGGVGRFAGVPCSFLGPLINAAEARGIYEPFVNEGDALAYAAGYALAGQKCAVLMQNSGLTNAMSPLTSLTELFGLRTLLVIGNCGADDEPQHKLMSGCVKPLLNVLNIPFFDAEDGESAVSAALRSERSAAILVNSRDTFSEVQRMPVVKPETKQTPAKEPELPLRYDVLKTVLACVHDAVFVTTTGFTSREMYCLNDRAENFYMVGSMGCLSSLALGIAESLPYKKVIAVDGDSACLMRLGALYTLSERKPKNLCYLVLDNEANESTGGQPNSKEPSRLYEVLMAMHHTYKTKSTKGLTELLTRFCADSRFTQIYMRIKMGSISDLPRPDRQLIFDQANRFTKHIRGD